MGSNFMKLCLSSLFLNKILRQIIVLLSILALQTFTLLNLLTQYFESKDQITIDKLDNTGILIRAMYGFIF